MQISLKNLLDPRVRYNIFPTVWTLLVYLLLFDSFGLPKNYTGVENLSFGKDLLKYHTLVLDFLKQPNLFWPFLPVLAVGFLIVGFIARFLTMALQTDSNISLCAGYGLNIGYWLLISCISYWLYSFALFIHRGSLYWIFLVLIGSLYSVFVYPFFKKHFGDLSWDIHVGLLTR
jgi:hypothetical protein